jgi:heat shock protein HslJ
MPEKSKNEQDKNKILAVIGVLIVAAVILIVLSFSKSQNPVIVEDVTLTEPPVAVDEQLTSQKWTWVNTQMNDGSESVPSTQGAFTLTFQEDGKVIATTDCNNGNGTYKLGPDNTIEFGPMASTMMYCEGSSETDFYKQIAEVGSYKLENDQLWLMIKYDSGTMIFE